MTRQSSCWLSLCWPNKISWVMTNDFALILFQAALNFWTDQNWRSILLCVWTSSPCRLCSLGFLAHWMDSYTVRFVESVSSISLLFCACDRGTWNPIEVLHGGQRLCLAHLLVELPRSVDLGQHLDRLARCCVPRVLIRAGTIILMWFAELRPRSNRSDCSSPWACFLGHARIYSFGLARSSPNMMK